MKIVFTSLLAAGLLASPMAEAAQQCAQPKDRSAFDIAGLKSELMVIALTCDVRDKYDSFVLRYRKDLVDGEKALQTYFRRAFGRRGQQEHDDYITSLANAQSEFGLHRGTLFCTENTGMFDEVMKIPTGTELSGYASSKGLTQPVALVTCTTPEPKVRRTRTASNVTTKKHQSTQ